MIVARAAVRRGRSARNERGLALLAAVLGLVLIGALVAGAFFASLLDQRTAQNVVYAAAAHEAAEAGLANVLASARAGNFLFGTADSVAYVSRVIPAAAPDAPSYAVWVFPLGTSMYLIKSRGTSHGATSTLAEFVKPAVASAPVAAPLTVAAPVTFSGNGFRIDGNNADPAIAAGCPPAPMPAQVYALRSQGSTGSTPAEWPNLLGLAGTGAPAGQGSALANDSTMPPLMTALFASGGTYDQLRAGATWSLAPGTYTQRRPSTTLVQGAARCDVADDRNWGEPWSGSGTTPECSTYFPVVLGASAFGNPVVVAGGRGQGVLLADGDLALSDGFEWTGLVLVKGNISIADATVRGAVVAQNAGASGANALGGSAQIIYSTCAISRALTGVAALRPGGTRAWTQLF